MAEMNDNLRVIKITPDTLDKLKDECRDYAEEQIDLDEKMEYIIELERCRNLNQLVNSGVFHDACGKLESISETEIVVNEEY